MATLTIRKLPDDVQKKLREIAAANGRSMEAEARAVLTEAVQAAQKNRSSKEAAEALRNLQKMMENVKPKKGTSLVDEFLAERRAMWGEDE
jgi:plasmid stability protein